MQFIPWQEGIYTYTYTYTYTHTDTCTQRPANRHTTGTQQAGRQEEGCSESVRDRQTDRQENER